MMLNSDRSLLRTVLHLWFASLRFSYIRVRGSHGTVNLTVWNSSDRMSPGLGPRTA